MTTRSAVAKELKQLGFAGTVEAETLLALARQLDEGDSPPAPIVREIVALMTQLRGVAEVTSPSDQLRAARERRRRGLAS